jgi:hypothetical protein
MARTESFFVERSKHGGDASSAVEEDNQTWKKLWAISAPGKMKIHLWRFAHDCLPSGVQLCRRHISVKERCVLAVGFWHLWLARNGVRNGEPMKHPHAVAEQIKAYVEMIELHILSPSPSNRRDTSSSTPRWSPLPKVQCLLMLMQRSSHLLAGRESAS